MDDLRTVFHLPINDAAKKVRKKRHALAHPRQKEQKQKEQKHVERNFFCLGFFGGCTYLGAIYVLFVFFARRPIWGGRFTQNSPPYSLSSVCPPNKTVGLMRDGS